jgi:hypothetical protein
VRIVGLVVALLGIWPRWGAALAAQEASREWLARMSLPRWVDSAVAPLTLTGPYQLELRLNPFVQLGDFDGDRQADAAVFVHERVSGKRGILLVRRAAPAPTVLGAGRAAGRLGDDFKWLDIWRVEAGEGLDRLLVEKSETATGSVVWDGRRFTITLVGD